jgi:acyl-CoA reductase-like NAD-dependent aldehyde dehydrogenase
MEIPYQLLPINRGCISQVWVNQYNLLNNNVPFGGKKQSGFGKLIDHWDVTTF